MGIVKAISGHTGARGVMRYLERDGRALARGRPAPEDDTGQGPRTDP